MFSSANFFSLFFVVAVFLGLDMVREVGCEARNVTTTKSKKNKKGRRPGGKDDPQTNNLL